MKVITRISLIAGIIGILYACGVTVNAAPYGAGAYGACNYQEDCTLSLSSSGVVALTLSPGASTVCSNGQDAVSVTTDNPLGYTLQLADTDMDTSLKNGAQSITASSGTFATPSSLAVNTWGYRVDGAGDFGIGPTSQTTNGASLSQTYAGIATSSSPVTIKTTSSAAASGDATNVWYGSCVDTSKASGSYVDSITYTLVAN